MLICVVPFASQPAPFGEISNSSFPMDLPSTRMLNFPLSGCSGLAALFFCAGKDDASPLAKIAVTRIDKIEAVRTFIEIPQAEAPRWRTHDCVRVFASQLRMPRNLWVRRKNQAWGFS